MSVQQIFETTFERPDLLPLGFALMASGMAVASLTNAAIVKRLGMRLIGHGALFFFTLVAGIHLCLSLAGYESLPLFITLQMLMMMGFSFVAGNFGAMAMENMGSIAGTASSLQGSVSTLLGTVCDSAALRGVYRSRARRPDCGFHHGKRAIFCGAPRAAASGDMTWPIGF